MKHPLFFFVLLLTISSCRLIDPIVPSEPIEVGGGPSGDIYGFFLLNEGNMGSNKCTLDFYDYASGIYSKNIFPERNPEIV